MILGGISSVSQPSGPGGKAETPVFFSYSISFSFMISTLVILSESSCNNSDKNRTRWEQDLEQPLWGLIRPREMPIHWSMIIVNDIYS